MSLLCASDEKSLQTKLHQHGNVLFAQLFRCKHGIEKKSKKNKCQDIINQKQKPVSVN